MTAGTSDKAGGAGDRRILLIGDTMLDPLARLLERSPWAPGLCSFAAPYGQVYQTLLGAIDPGRVGVPPFIRLREEG